MNQYKQRMFEPCLHPFVFPFLKNSPPNLSHFLLSAQHQSILESLVDFYSLGSFFKRVVGVDNEFATIEWEKEYPDVRVTKHTCTEKVELSSIHENGWTDYYGSSIGIFYEREENE